MTCTHPKEVVEVEEDEPGKYTAWCKVCNKFVGAWSWPLDTSPHERGFRLLERIYKAGYIEPVGDFWPELDALAIEMDWNKGKYGWDDEKKEWNFNNIK